jgi:hypothetical protein
MMDNQIPDQIRFELMQAIRCLKSRRKRVREAAGRKLLQHPDEAIELLLETLRLEAQKRPLRNGVGLAIALVTIIFAYTMLIRAFLSGGFFQAMEVIIRVGYMTLLGVWGAMIGLRPSSFQVNIARILVQFEDLRIVGPLVEASLSTDDKEVKDSVRGRLVELLPRLGPEHSVFFTDQQYMGLHSLLLTTNNIKFAVMILKAYERLEDHRLLRVVERLAKGKGSLLAVGRDSQVRIAAIECLEHLEKHTVTGKQTLLRPADNPSASAEILLRPAETATLTQPHELLRAVDGE